MVGRFACAFWSSGLDSGFSLALFQALPGGGLTPRVGRIIVLSNFGKVYYPYMVNSTCLYSISPNCLIHSLMFFSPSLT